MNYNISKKDIEIVINNFGCQQLSDEQMAAKADCLLEEWEQILAEDGNLRRKLKIERLKGQAMLAGILWNDILNGKDNEVHRALLKRQVQIEEKVVENVSRVILEGLSTPELAAKVPELCVKIQEELHHKKEKF